MYFSRLSLLPIALVTLTVFSAGSRASAQDSPYFVTYDHQLEDTGDLETSVYAMIGVPRAGQHAYVAPLAEFEYGVRDWWTSSLYLEGQGTEGDSTIFTGWRFENRFRPLKAEHRVNPVLYFEYENTNEASRVQKEIVGNSSDFSESNAEQRGQLAREIEGKLILSSTVRKWNVAENFIVEKNLTESEGVEFGYALGVARPLADPRPGSHCVLCRQNVSAGVELYGGLGSTLGFGLHDTTHYLAPAILWKVSERSTLHFSPAIGLTTGASPALFRVGYSYEIEDFGDKVASLFRRKN